MKKKKQNNWTIFFIIKCASRSIESLSLMIDELKSTSFSSDIDVVFCIYTLESNIDAIIEGRNSVCRKEKETTALTTFFSRLVPSRTSEKFPYQLEMLAKKPNFDITNEEDLAVYFRNVVLNKFIAKKYMLFTWDHGRGYGIFAEDPASGQPKIDVTATGHMKILTMDELANALSWAFGDQKVDIIAMMNCTMQVIDTGYALRNVGRYLIAPEVPIDYRGYNYTYLFQLMAMNKKIATKRIAEAFVRSLPLKIFQNHDKTLLQRSISAVSATKLNYYGLLASLTEELGLFLSSVLLKKGRLIAEARNKNEVAASIGLVDYLGLINSLEEVDLFEDLPVLANRIVSVISQLISFSYVGIKGTAKKNKPTGLSIYFPAAFSLDPNPIKNMQTTLFFKETRWKDFLTQWGEFIEAES